MYNNTRITLRHLLLASAFCAGTGMAWAAPAATAPASTAPPPPQPATVVDATPVGADVSVTAKQQLGADQDLDNWILYGRTYDNQRFSPLNEITADNIGKLQPVAIIQTGVVGSFENSPIVVNGIMYISTPYDHVLAYDATTGKELWSYTPDLGYTQLCCGPEVAVWRWRMACSMSRNSTATWWHSMPRPARSNGRNRSGIRAAHSR